MYIIIVIMLLLLYRKCKLDINLIAMENYDNVKSALVLLYLPYPSIIVWVFIA